MRGLIGYRGTMEAIVIIPIAVVLIVLVGFFGLGGMRLLRRQQVERQQDVASGKVNALRYHVPIGQDPAAVTAALLQDGYEVVRDDVATHVQELLILCPAGVDRERARVRSVITHEAAVDMEGHPMPEHDVVFDDERRAG
jgi:hypothetical protein